MSSHRVRAIWLSVLLSGGFSWAEAPQVVATDPANGATSIPGNLQRIVITFNTTMAAASSIGGIGSWIGSYSWSPDKRELTLNRSATAADWSTGTVVSVILNQPPYFSFEDTSHNRLGTYTFCFTVGGAANPSAPTVQSTQPANGALEVDRTLQQLTITFSEPMATGTSVNVSGPWLVSGATPHSWSGDGRTLTLGRDSAASPMAASTVVTVRLNPTGSGFQDPQGNPLAAHSFSFTTAAAPAGEKPVVESSSPADGTVGVGVFTREVALTFSKPMDGGHGIACTTGNWDVARSSVGWSTDRRIFYLTRSDGDRLLPFGERVGFTLNPTGSQGFRDTDGNLLDASSYSFTVEPESQVIKVLPSDGVGGFSWPYYLWIPSDVPATTTILVEPNNSGFVSDAEMDHDSSTMSLLGWRSKFAARLKVPLLVPAFPRPRASWQIYTHALDRDSMTTTGEALRRIDLQLIEMIDDARERLADLGIFAEEKVLIMGFSASGMFTNRFAILHPERVRAAAAGSPGGWPLAPVASWQGETLPYNVGIADVDSLLGRSLDLAAVRAVPTYLYMGNADTNDSVPYSDSYDDAQREQVNRLFGTTPVTRWPRAEEIYRSAGMNATFVLYSGVGHTITSQMLDDIAEFLTAHLKRRVVFLRHGGARRAPDRGGGLTTGIALSPALAGGRHVLSDWVPPLHEDPPPSPPSPPVEMPCHAGACPVPAAAHSVNSIEH